MKVLSLPSYENRWTDLAKAFQVADCWLIFVDMKGSAAVKVAKSLLPNVKLCFITAKTSPLTEQLGELEANLCCRQRRKLSPKASTTGADLQKLAAQLPTLPQLPDDPQSLLKSFAIPLPCGTTYEPIVHLEASAEKVTTSQLTTEEGLLPDSLLLAKSAAEHGLVTAPSLAVPGAPAVEPSLLHPFTFFYGS